MKPRLLVPLLSLLACLALASPAAAGMTGNWSGETSQDLGLDEPYTTDIGFSVLNGRIVTVYGEVRMLCGETAIQDVRVLKSYRSGQGPKVSGGFSFTVQGLHLSGHLGKKSGSGAASASKGGCSGSGKWTVTKRKGV